jgi:hypothetical protein
VLITVATRSKARTVFARSNSGVVGSNATLATDICVCLYCLALSCVRRGLAPGWSYVLRVILTLNEIKEKTPWPESVSELYRSSDQSLSAKLVPTFSDGGCYVVSVTDLYGRILCFRDRSRYFFFQVDPQLYSRG